MADDIEAKIKKAVYALLRRKILVGIPDSTATATPVPGEKKRPSNAVLGYLNELGDDELNIPPRPFLVPGVEGMRDQIVKQMELAAATAFTGDIDGMDKRLDGLGLALQSAVQKKITDGPFTPLSPNTVYNRLHRKKAPRDSDKPLIDTGALRASVTYVIKGR